MNVYLSVERVSSSTSIDSLIDEDLYDVKEDRIKRREFSFFDRRKKNGRRKRRKARCDQRSSFTLNVATLLMMTFNEHNTRTRILQFFAS